MKQEPDAPKRQDRPPQMDEPSGAPPRIERQPTGALTLAIIRALIAYALMNILARLLHGRQGFAVVFDMVGTAAFLPFSAALAAAIGRQHGLVLCILAITMLTSWPANVLELEHLVAPIAVGILTGTGIARVMKEGGAT
ncbi:MAG: hypothetical protein ACHREM_11975 [Polyangiales bacterium]